VLSEKNAELVEDSEPMPPLNHNQAGLIDFAESLEGELDSPADELKLRTIRSTRRLQDRVAVAIERVELFLEGALIVQVDSGPGGR
jgi:hypothetical protein